MNVLLCMVFDKCHSEQRQKIYVCTFQTLLQNAMGHFSEEPDNFYGNLGSWILEHFQHKVVLMQKRPVNGIGKVLQIMVTGLCAHCGPCLSTDFMQMVLRVSWGWAKKGVWLLHSIALDRLYWAYQIFCKIDTVRSTRRGNILWMSCRFHCGDRSMWI